MATIQEQVSLLLYVNKRGEIGLDILKPNETSPRAVRCTLHQPGDKGVRELYKRALTAMNDDTNIHWPDAGVSAKGTEYGGDPARHNGEAKLWVGLGKWKKPYWTSAERRSTNAANRRRYL